MDFFDPNLVLTSHIPDLTADVGHKMILRQRGGGMLNFGFISAFLLRYTGDVQVWRLVQISDLIVDFAYFWAVYSTLSVQQRLDPVTWRAEDWGSIVITGTATVTRIAFLTRVGLKKKPGIGKKKKVSSCSTDLATWAQSRVDVKLTYIVVADYYNDIA